MKARDIDPQLRPNFIATFRQHQPLAELERKMRKAQRRARCQPSTQEALDYRASVAARGFGLWPKAQ